MTSRWLMEVEAARPRGHVVVIGRSKHRDLDAPLAHGQRLGAGADDHRGCRGERGRQTLRRDGARIHLGKVKDLDQVLRESPARSGCERLASAAHHKTHDAARGAVYKRGSASSARNGAPIISVEGIAFFGPVVTLPPRARTPRLWDGCVLVAGTPGF